jgi:pimeloyl-ACP methyl ester carboxylesterase
MPFVAVRERRRLFVRVVGRGQPVLLLPGLGMHSVHWLPFLLPYLGRFRFYLPDLRGSGRSSRVPLDEADIFQSHADDVREVIAHFGLDDFLLGGISLGCTTSLHMLRDFGFSSVRRYLHIDQSPCVGNREGWRHGLFGEQQEERFRTFRQALVLLDTQANAKRLADFDSTTRAELAGVLSLILAAMAGDKRRAPGLARLMRSPLSGLLPFSNLDHVRTYLRAYLAGGHDYRDALRGCTTPITLMVGMKSALYPAEGQFEIARLAARVKVVRFERSGHVPLIDAPVKLVRELGRWLNDEETGK